MRRGQPRRGLVVAVSDERESEQDEHARQQRVQALARQIADTINAAPVAGREGLRESVSELLDDTVQTTDASSTDALSVDVPGQRQGSFNPFGIGIPLILMGAVTVFLFPPVGLLLFGAASVMIVWGVGATLLARS